MNYVYDILLNFNEKIYDFYDWNKEDHIRHIKKIPIIKINNKKFEIIRNNQIKFDEQFLNKICNKTEEFFSRKNKILKYACLFTDEKSVIGVYVDKKINYSKLLLDEEIEILDVAKHINETEIKFEIINKNNNQSFKTRKQIELIEKTQREIKKIISENNIEKLKYIYYECFNKKTDSIKKIILELQNNIEKNIVIEKINNLVNINNV